MDVLRKSAYEVLIWVIKYVPIITHFIIVLNILDYFVFGYSYTNWLYPIIGHSIIYDLMLLIFSYKLKFCLWHRILIWDMILNIVFEWICVNIHISEVVHFFMVISLLSVVCSVILAVTAAFVCRIKNRERESNGRKNYDRNIASKWRNSLRKN